MGREIKRVPVDFDWPLEQRWEGYLMPDTLDEIPCPTCLEPKSYVGERDHSDGLTPEARAVANTFYPHMIQAAGAYLGAREHADRLAWCDKLGQAEVDMLIDERRIGMHKLFDRVELDEPIQHIEDDGHAWTQHYEFVRNDVPAPTPAVINAENRPGARGGTGWSGIAGHDGINRMLLVRFRCERLGIVMECPDCEGHGTVEAYPGQRAEAEAWERTDPPTGEGWQLWETVSEGSPISPVFPDAEGLAQWLTTPASAHGTQRPMTIEQARGFVGVGWAPSLIGNAGGIHDGAEFVGTQAALGDRG